jgi:hypothetical protein
LVKKLHQMAVGGFIGMCQVRIGNKQIFHGAYYSSRP